MKIKMKILALFLSVLASSYIQASEPKTSIEFPLTGETYVDGKSVKINVKTLNKKLKKQNLEGLPETIVINEDSKPYWHLLMKRIQAAQEVMPDPLEFVIDKAYVHEFSSLCYRGNISEVYKVIEANLGTFFHDEQGFLAVRWGAKKIVFSDEFKSDDDLKEAYQDDNPGEVKAWLGYKTDSKTVLLMSNLGAQGDGTELYATKIEACKD